MVFMHVSFVLLQFKVVGPNKRADSEDTANMWCLAWQGLLTQQWVQFWSRQLRRITDMVVGQTLFICGLKSIVMQVFRMHILPHYRSLHPAAPESQYIAVDEWDFPQPPPEHKALVQENAVTLWDEMVFLRGVKVILLTNVKGAANKTLTTGLVGEVQSFQDFTVCELADMIERRTRMLQQGELLRTLKLYIHVVTGQAVSTQHVSDILSRTAPDQSLLFPQVDFFDPVTRTHNIVTVFPVTFSVYSTIGQRILSRTMLPFASADVVKPGQSLGCTTDKDVFIDPCALPTAGTQPFMAMTRQGNPERVFFDRSTAVGADMFAVSDAVREFYLGGGWEEVHVPIDASVQGPFQALAG
jgi:hypothetical protein